MAVAVICLPSEARRRGTVTILHTSDTHSCIMPLSSALADTVSAGRGGYVRRVALVAQERTKDGDLLLLDCGDFSQGSPYYSIYKGDVEVGMMNIMGYDAAAIGNHEFDYGLENMARLFRMAQFPIVCANYDFSGTPVEGLVKPYIIVERGGLRIGIFGISPRLEGLVMESACQGVTFIDPVEAANAAVDDLRSAGCDIIICLSHLGWDIGGIDDEALISATEGIDIVLGGHSHTYMTEMEYVDNATGTPVPVDHEGKNGVFVGKITITRE